MTDNGDRSTFERAVEALVYAPVGMALFARDVLPPLFQQFVARGKAEFDTVQERVSEQVGQAKVIGQFAVTQGGEQLRREMASRIDSARERGQDLARLTGVGFDGAETPSTSPSTPPAPTRSHAGERLVAPPDGDASHLPIPDYDELSASQVVARLGGLDPEQLGAVADYERARRQRKTILTKIEQLTA